MNDILKTIKVILSNNDKIFLIVIFIPLLAIIFNYIIDIVKKKKIKKKINSLAENTKEFTPKEFFNMKKLKLKDFKGIYILFNENKNMYYVGQSINVLKRINNHLTGKGNGDVYADYKYGDSFKIKTLPLYKSGFETLNSLEKSAIYTYSAFSKGYNKNKGNRG